MRRNFNLLSFIRLEPTEIRQLGHYFFFLEIVWIHGHPNESSSQEEKIPEIFIRALSPSPTILRRKSMYLCHPVSINGGFIAFPPLFYVRRRRKNFRSEIPERLRLLLSICLLSPVVSGLRSSIPWGYASVVKCIFRARFAQHHSVHSQLEFVQCTTRKLSFVLWLFNGFCADKWQCKVNVSNYEL